MLPVSTGNSMTVKKRNGRRQTSIQKKMWYRNRIVKLLFFFCDDIYIYNDIYKYTYIFTNIYYIGKVDALLSELISSQLGRSMRLRP